MVSENINRLLIAFGNACLEMGKAIEQVKKALEAE